MFSEGRYSRDFPGPLSARVLSAAALRAGRWLCVTSGSRSCVPKADALLLASLFALGHVISYVSGEQTVIFHFGTNPTPGRCGGRGSPTRGAPTGSWPGTHKPATPLEGRSGGGSGAWRPWCL